MRALGFEQHEWQTRLPVGVVDVARLGLSPEDQSASLRRMAETHLGLRIQQGGAKHCAVLDALVALRLYEAITSRET